jgi:hypothetical protein
MKWSAVRWFGILVLLGMAACKNNPDVNVTAAPGITPPGSPTVATIQVANSGGSGGPFTISTGQTLQLTPTALDASNATVTGVSYTWSSSSPATATVSSTGLVTGVAIGGPVTIHATNASITSNDVSLTVSCAGIPSNAVTPMSVTLNPGSPMNVNAITSVTAAVFDCTGLAVPDNTSVTFTLNTSSLGNLSTGSSLATTVSVPTAGGAGLASASFVAGPSPGSVTITATAGTLSASVTVDINALPVLGIQFLSAVPQVVGVKGSGQTEVSEVSFSVTDTQGNPFGDGLAVNFEFLNGMNPGGGAAIDPPAAATIGGIAKTFLKSGFVAGPTRILAYVDANGNGIFDSGEVYSTSTPLSIGGGIPSARFFTVEADVHNLAGLAYDDQIANITAKMADRFGNFNVLQGTSVSFYTEAGAIDRQGVTDDQGKTTVLFRTQNRWPIDTDPRQDLNPIGNELFLYNNLNASGHDTGEPFEDLNGNGIFTTVISAGVNGILDTAPAGDDIVDGTRIVAGPNHIAESTAVVDDVQVVPVSTQVGYDIGEHFFDLNGNGYDLGEPNPRDGWVTVLAVTQGEETFYDTNGNGIYDPGEPFDDNGGEPFIDENDNGIYDGPEEFIDMNANNSYDPGEPFYDKGRGEPFFDTNGNGVRDAGEPFVDMNGNLTYDGPGDSYIDTNGNGVWDSGEPCKDAFTNAPKGGTCNTDTTGTIAGFYNHVFDHGEFYVDVDGNGKWTAPNGQWDSNTAIWINLRSPNQLDKKSTTMIFTGPPDFSNETSKIVIDELHRDPRPGLGSNYWINNGECADMEIYIADINNNAPIPGTTIALTVDQGILVGSAARTIPDNPPPGPYVFGVSVCDDDVSKIEMKSSSLKVDISWQPQNAGAIGATMGVSGTKDAPNTLAVTITSPNPLQNGAVLCATTPCYNVSLSASGGAPSYTWLLTAGTLPPNFNMDSTGLITQNGTSIIGTYNFTVQVTDVLGSTDTKALSITVS